MEINLRSVRQSKDYPFVIIDTMGIDHKMIRYFLEYI
jgi:hypothetical protein